MTIVAVTIGVAITVGSYLRRAPETRGESTVEATFASAEIAVERPVRLRPAVTAAAPIAGAAPSAPNVSAAPLPAATPVTPLAQIFEARQAQVPPMLAEREREFAAQSVDRTWAPGAAARILDRFAQAQGIAFSTLQVECKSTMCRLEAVSPNLPAASAPQFNIIGNSIGLAPDEAITISDTLGTLHTVAFFWRDGLGPAPVRRPPPRAD